MTIRRIRLALVASAAIFALIPTAQKADSA
jgi:hypothetical protein